MYQTSEFQHGRGHQTGVGLVEAIVVISIASVAFAALLSAAVFFLRGGLASADRAQALYLMEEGVEAVRFFRDQSYSMNITPHIDAGAFYISPSTAGFEATTTAVVDLGAYTRTVTIEHAYRRVSDSDIVPATSGGPKAIDPDTAFVTISVTWPEGSVDTETYVTNMYDN